MPDAPERADGIGIRPAHLSIVDPALAARVVAPAYDTLSPEARARIAGDDPYNYLNVLRSPEDVGDDLPGALRRNSMALRRMLRAGVFHAGAGPRLAWYRLAKADDRQTAVIAEVAIADYDRGRVMRHEHTRADREAQLAAHLETVGVSSSPVALAYRPAPALRALATAATATAPLVRFTSGDGVEHTVWTIEDTRAITEICAALRTVQRLYITDGHHRFAAAARVAAAGRAIGHDADAPDQWLLAALFPSNELRIMPFHRVVARPRDRSTVDLLAALGTHADVHPLDGPEIPRDPHRYVVYLDGQWFALGVDVGERPDADRVAALDVVVLHEHVLGPVFGVVEPRFDRRLGYVAGGPADVAAHCDDAGAIGFVVRATSMDELMAVADAELALPPKSTRFVPKVRSGLFLRALDERRTAA